MTITVYPADAVAGAPAYTGRKLRQVGSALAAGATPARPLGGLSGVRPGSGTVGSATSTTWTITPHAGQLDLEAAAEASVYLYSIDANLTGSVAAADASNPRVDIVYLTLSDPAEGDGSSTPGVASGYLAGTPASTPAAPAAPARSLVLYTIAVPKVGGGSPTVTMAAPEVGGAGAPIGVRSQAQRDALVKYPGRQVVRLDAGSRLETCDGTLWAGQGTELECPTIALTVPATTITAVKWDAASTNTADFTKSSSFEWTCTRAGLYALSTLVSVGSTQNTRAYVDLYSDGVRLPIRTPFTGDSRGGISQTVRLNVGSIIKVEVYCATATAINGGWLAAVRIGS